jgi:hypothetical protein
MGAVFEGWAIVLSNPLRTGPGRQFPDDPRLAPLYHDFRPCQQPSWNNGCGMGALEDGERAGKTTWEAKPTETPSWAGRSALRGLARQPQSPRWIGCLAPAYPFIIGIASALLLWGLLALVPLGKRIAAADGPNQAQYEELRSRLNLLRSNLTTLSRRTSWMTRRELVGYENAKDEHTAACRTLQELGLQWLRGTGYIDVRMRLHRAEEELIQTQSKAEAIGGALDDHLRLHGCEMTNRDELMRNLRFAVSTIKPEMVPYFIDEPESPGMKTTIRATTLKHKYPRAVLKEVRHTINDYRNEQRRGLLRVRNGLLIAVMVTEVLALLLLGFAVMANPDTTNIEAAVAFFLVGAVLGLLYNRVRTALETTDTVDEGFGLSMARLWATPLFSGMAAIGGVLLVAVVPNVVDITPLTEPTGSQVNTDPRQLPPNLNEIFTLESLNIVIAAIFGLSPVYFFDRLKQGDKLLSNLRSTEPANRANARADGPPS